MGFQIKLFGISAPSADLEYIGPCECELGDTYAAFRVLIEEIGIVNWLGLFVHPPTRPPCPVDLHACLTKKYLSIFKYIRAYLSIFKVFSKKIQRICLIRPVHAWGNGQDRPPACPLRPPVSLRTPSMTTLRLANSILG
jgi:hypothetical protein